MCVCLCVGARARLCVCVAHTVVFGEDVAFGGVFRCTTELQDKFGKLHFTSKYNVQLLPTYLCPASSVGRA